jgi:hypothetical protein
VCVCVCVCERDRDMDMREKRRRELDKEIKDKRSSTSYCHILLHTATHCYICDLSLLHMSPLILRRALEHDNRRQALSVRILSTVLPQHSYICVPLILLHMCRQARTREGNEGQGQQ